MSLDRNGLEILSRGECLTLLAARPVGRVAISADALPLILPVSYRLLGEDVLFATGTGSKSLAHGNVIAFEVDDVDPATRCGWSVLAVGVARHVDERHPDWAAARRLDLHPWVGRNAVQLVRLATDRLSGRRLSTAVGPISAPVAVPARR